jgi:hypothetical protein
VTSKRTSGRNRSLFKVGFFVLLAATILLALPVAAAVASSPTAPAKDMREFAAPRSVKPVPAAERVRKPLNVTSRPEPEWRRGIIDSGQAPFPAQQYQFENQWQDVVGGKHTNVWAGASGNDPQQGVIVVLTTSVDLTQTGSPEVFPTPSRTGALRITDAHGTVLTLVDSTGATFTFRVESRQLVAG